LAGIHSFIIKTPPIPQVKCQSAFTSVGKMLLELLLRTFQVDRREEEEEEEKNKIILLQQQQQQGRAALVVVSLHDRCT